MVIFIYKLMEWRWALHWDLLAEICIVELERSLDAKLSSYIKFWKQCVDDTITLANVEAIDHILTILNRFDPNI